MNMEFDHRKIVIPEEKIRAYLLSTTHPTGKYKAKWFIKNGFTPEYPAELDEAILQIAEEGTVQNEIETKHGVKYIVAGDVESPDGEKISLITVWIQEENCSEIRFVTAYPDH